MPTAAQPRTPAATSRAISNARPTNGNHTAPTASGRASWPTRERRPPERTRRRERPDVRSALASRPAPAFTSLVLARWAGIIVHGVGAGESGTCLVCWSTPPWNWIGANNALISGSFRFSGVAITSPVLISSSTFSPLGCSDNRLDRQIAHLQRTPQDYPLHSVLGQGPRRSVRSDEADEDHLARRARHLPAPLQRAGGVRVHRRRTRPRSGRRTLLDHPPSFVEGGLRRVAAVLIIAYSTESSSREIPPERRESRPPAPTCFGCPPCNEGGPRRCLRQSGGRSPRRPAAELPRRLSVATKSDQRAGSRQDSPASNPAVKNDDRNPLPGWPP